MIDLLSVNQFPFANKPHNHYISNSKRKTYEVNN